MLKAIIFDLDDTLLDDKRSIKEAFRATCQLAEEKYAIDPEQLEEAVRKYARKLYATYPTYNFTQNIGINPFEGLWGTFDDHGDEFQALHRVIIQYQHAAWQKGLEAFQIEDDELAGEMARAFPKNRKKHPFVFEDTYPVLDELSDKYELILLTNGAPSLQNTKLNLTPQLKEYFQKIIISGNFGVGKPDPSIFQYVLEVTNLESNEMIMVGDNLNTDILGSNRIGMENVWINHHGIKAEDVKSTYEISRLKELLPLLNEKEI